MFARTLLRHFTKQNRNGTIKNPEKQKQFDEMARKYALLVMPFSAFCLGTWQIFRREWKLNLIQRLESRIAEEPVDLPPDPNQLEELEYRRVKVKGKYDHSRELYLSPRSLIKAGAFESESTGGGLISSGKGDANIGVNVVTAFQLSDRPNTKILVNRGWIPRNNINQQSRKEGQIEGQIELTGVVRKTEGRPPFGKKNDPSKKEFHHRDIDLMSRVLGTDQIFIDADEKSTVPGGPIGGQTRVSLRNEHLSYILTWYSLSLITLMMWYVRFRQKKPKAHVF